MYIFFKVLVFCFVHIVSEAYASIIIPMIDGKQEQLGVQIYTQISRYILALNKTFPP